MNSQHFAFLLLNFELLIMHKKKELLTSWLKDAYVMEKSLIKTMQTAVKGAKDYPDVEEKINEHIAVTERQAERLQQRLEAMGEKVSGLKVVSGEIMAKMPAYGTKLFNDTIVKNSLMQAAGEAFEIACYDALIAAAEHLGDDETAELARDIKEEEEEMQEWLKEHLPVLIDQFLGEKEIEEHQESGG